MCARTHLRRVDELGGEGLSARLQAAAEHGVNVGLTDRVIRICFECAGCRRDVRPHTRLPANQQLPQLGCTMRVELIGHL